LRDWFGIDIPCYLNPAVPHVAAEVKNVKKFYEKPQKVKTGKAKNPKPSGKKSKSREQFPKRRKKEKQNVLTTPEWG